MLSRHRGASASAGTRPTFVPLACPRKHHHSRAMTDPKRPKRPRDLSQLAKALFDESIGEAPSAEPDTRDPHALALGVRGWSKGGKARAEKLSPEKRREIAKKAAAARWKNDG
jgi:hypothetical protein